jgi:quercetin dioxygenase-like cupin family protein
MNMTDQFEYVANLEELITEIPADSIVSRTYYQNDQMKAILFGFAKGQVLSEHTAARPAILHFVKGEASITLGDVAQQASENTWVYMEPKLSHSIEAKTDLWMLLLML